jgi:hypothetical protein
VCVCLCVCVRACMCACVIAVWRRQLWIQDNPLPHHAFTQDSHTCEGLGFRVTLCLFV